MSDFPTIWVYGVGHSGTTIVTKMLHRLGWKRFDADRLYAESMSMRDINIRALHHEFDIMRAVRYLERMPEGCAVKDPRLVEFLPYWINALKAAGRRVTLLRITRPANHLERSYRRRNEYVDRQGVLFPGVRGHTVLDLVRLADKHFWEWPNEWPKYQLDFNTLRKAVAMFDESKIVSG